MRRTLAILASTAVAASTVALAAPARAAENIPAGGASFPFVFISQCAADFNASQNNFNVTYTSTGSGTGKSNFTRGTFVTAMTDSAYSSTQTPPSWSWEYIPAIGGAITVPINLKNAQTGRTLGSSIQLKQTTLAKIFGGAITTWNHPEIIKDNPRIAKALPATPITIAYRSDASGTTNNFLQYLNAWAPSIFPKVQDDMGTAFPGLGGHVSVSLKSKKTAKNAFADQTAPHGLSTLARNFLAGVIDIVPEAFAMCAQTVNAYRRFAPGSWAPKTISWSPYNYTTAIRIACESETLTRMECRLPGADCNVFLTLAMLLGAGLDGLERKLDLKDQPLLAGSPTEIPAGATRLPRDLMEATDRLRGSARTREIYGASFIEHFAKLCEAESASLVRSVSPAEIERYLEGG